VNHAAAASTMMIAMKRTVVALLWIAALIASHIRFSTSFAPYRPGALLKVESLAEPADGGGTEGRSEFPGRFNLQRVLGPVGGVRCRCGHENRTGGRRLWRAIWAWLIPFG
jgi:hypothetical protein